MFLRHPALRASLASLLLLLVLLPAASPSTAVAQVQDGATMTVLRGQVAVIHTDGSSVQPAPTGTVVKAGDEIRTLNRTSALITFFAGTEIEMGEDTILVVERVAMNGAKVDISLKQVLGVTLNRVQSLTDPASTYKIDAGGASAVVRGTTFLLIGPVPTSQGNISALVCLDDCDGRTTFAGCPTFPYAAFGVTVEHDRPTSGCETTSVDKSADYFNAGFEAITTFEQAFASANGNDNPGIVNPGREEGQRRADDRESREDRADEPVVAATNACAVGAPVFPPGGPPTLYPVPGSVVEGNAGTRVLTIPVHLFPASGSAVTVNYATGGPGSTATAGSDYVAAGGTLTFPPGSTVQNIPITVNGDVAVEFDETIIVTLSGAVGAPLAFPTTLGQIRDDDGPIQLRVDDTSTFEGNAGTTFLVFPVTLSRPSAVPLSVTYQTIPGGSASVGPDYSAVAPTVLNIPANVTSATFNVPVTTDLTAEPTETVLVLLSAPGPGAVIIDPSATGTILDDDGPATLAVFGGSEVEGCDGTSTFAFTVQLSRPLASAVSVSFNTVNGTATAGSDFQALSGTVTFAPGAVTQTIHVQVLGDQTPEPDETFSVTIFSPVGATIAVPTATGTILNDD